MIQQFIRHHWYFINYNNLNFWVFSQFLSSAQIVQRNDINLPRQGIIKPECTLVPFILITTTSVGASTRVLGLTGLPLWYKNNLLIEWYIILDKCDFPQPSSHEKKYMKWHLRLLSIYRFGNAIWTFPIAHKIKHLSLL